MNLNGPLGRPSGIGFRPVTKRWLTAGTYKLILPADMQWWTLLDFLLISGGGDATVSASGGGGGGGGGTVKGQRWNFAPSMPIPIVVGAHVSASSAAFPSVAGGTASATGGASAVGTGGGAAGVGSTSWPGDKSYTGTIGNNGNAICGLVLNGIGGQAVYGGIPDVNQYVPGTPAGSGIGGIGSSSGSPQVGTSGEFTCTIWTQDPNYLPSVI